jgi:hypothetical protein
MWQDNSNPDTLINLLCVGQHLRKAPETNQKVLL